MAGYSGLCVGGPMNAMDGSSRFPSGFVLVCRLQNRVWIYDWVEGKFLVRIQDGVELVEDPEASKNRWRAAIEREFEVRTCPWTHLE